MSRILIIKTGTALPALIARKGDFEDMVIRSMGIEKSEAIVVDVTRGSPLPGYGEISAAVITGSHAMVTEHQEWSEQTAQWLRNGVENHLPVLGICYGHQLLAYALGGVVCNNPRGREMGTVDLFLKKEAAYDPLFGNFQSPIKVHVSHKQTVLKIPEKARVLAVSSGDDCQAFVAGECAWGVQFHPEFDRETITSYIDFYKEELLQEGKTPDLLIRNSTDTSYGAEILKCFISRGVKNESVQSSLF